jgi:hypothetical protein
LSHFAFVLAFLPERNVYMSSQITEAHVQQYSANVFHLSQQKGSRLAMAVRNEQQAGTSAFYDRIGSVAAVKITARHSDTPQLDTPHSRRRVSLQDYAYSDFIDEEDRIRMLIDPTSPYVEAAVWSLGRAKDDEIIAAASGLAYSGETGSTTVSLGNSQKIAAVSGSAGSNLNVAALRNAKEILDGNDVDESIPRYCAATSSQIAALLGETEVTSADFNTIRALVMGEIDTFLGFKFIRTQRLATQSGALSFNETSGAVGSGAGDADGYRKVICWAQDGILLSTGKEIVVRIDERSDKNYSTQVYAKGSFSATRMEEEKLVEILCNES